jgi:hypothetical protein
MQTQLAQPGIPNDIVVRGFVSRWTASCCCPTAAVRPVLSPIRTGDYSGEAGIEGPASEERFEGSEEHNALLVQGR